MLGTDVAPTGQCMISVDFQDTLLKVKIKVMDLMLSGMRFI